MYDVLRIINSCQRNSIIFVDVRCDWIQKSFWSCKHFAMQSINKLFTPIIPICKFEAWTVKLPGGQAHFNRNNMQKQNQSLKFILQSSSWYFMVYVFKQLKLNPTTFFYFLPQVKRFSTFYVFEIIHSSTLSTTIHPLSLSQI